MMSSGNSLERDLNAFVVQLVNEAENYAHFLKVARAWVDSCSNKSQAEKTVENAKQELVFIKQALM